MEIERRRLLFGGGAVLATAAAAATVRLIPSEPVAPSSPKIPPPPSVPGPAVQTTPAADARRLFLHNLHTGDTVDIVYWEAGRYVDDALAEARFALRDWRNGDQHEMDPGLFDILHQLSNRVETSRPFQIISGYRSAATNAALHARSSGVAQHSLHTRGMAADIRVEGIDLAHLRKAALSLRGGGVGYYPQSQFVHVDTGRIRQWAGA